ncbi:hypothetical protein BC830DRAFT_464136 [Chytriomyces sp. MP71]|nr:hypothetical protein BC830DRAFT_464136 [Chytriomyces sp. MP71]
MHLDPKSPLLAASPQRDLDQFANLEDRFCRDFSCCGIALASMHDLLQHFEEFHVLVESDYDDDVDFEDEDEDEDYEEHFPFEIDDSMDMDEFDIVSVQQQQEFNTAFLKAQIASINNNTPTTMSAGPSVSDPRFILQQQQHQQHQQQQEQQHVTRATISSLLGNTSRTPSNTSTFSQIQRYDNQVDVFRIMPPQRSHSEAVPSPSAFNPFPLPQRTASAYTPGPAASHDAPPSAFNDTVIRKRTVSSINSNINNSVHSSNPGTPVAPAASAGATRRRRASASYDVDTPPALLPFCTDATPTHVYHEDESMGECEDTDMAESFVSTSASGAAVGMAHHRAPASDYGGDDLSEVIPVPGSAGLSGEGSSATGVPSTSRGGAARGGAGGIGATGDERPFKCKVERCGKEYKNPNGLKYHMRNGHGQDTGNPEVDVLVNKPYQCVVDGCGKRYKNLNGLKYHIQHA